MKLINPKFAAAACLFGILAAPAASLAVHFPPPPPWYGKPATAKMAEPSSLVMTLVGIGLGIGLAVVGLRRNRSRNVTA